MKTVISFPFSNTTANIHYFIPTFKLFLIFIQDGAILSLASTQTNRTYENEYKLKTKGMIQQWLTNWTENTVANVPYIMLFDGILPFPLTSLLFLPL